MADGTTGFCSRLVKWRQLLDSKNLITRIFLNTEVSMGENNLAKSGPFVTEAGTGIRRRLPSSSRGRAPMWWSTTAMPRRVLNSAVKN